MKSLLPFVVTGVVTGSLYGLAAAGLVLTYRTSGVFNFGHGAIGAGAAFLFHTLHVTHDIPWPVALAVTVGLFAVGVGLLMERLTRSLAGASEALVIVATVGVMLATQGCLYLLYGNATRSFPEFLPASGFKLAGVNITWSQVISVVIATAGAAALHLYLRRSRLGVAMRAAVDNPTLLALAGERPRRVRQAAWAIGSGFAALSGVLLARTLHLDVSALTLLVVQAFGACAIGLFTSLPMTYAGGIAVGLTASLATKFFTDQPFNGVPPAVPFLVLIVVLLAVPPGRLPQQRARLRSLVADARPMARRHALTAACVGAGALLLLPDAAGTFLPLWISGLVSLVMFASLALLVWTSGQISLCHTGFVALGATTMSHLLLDAHLPWGVALVLAGVLTVPVGALVAVPAIRLSGLYLALATLGFGIFLQQILYPSDLMFGFRLSVLGRRPELGPFDGYDDTVFYYLVLAIAVASVAAIVLIGKSRLGRLLRAMSEAPTMLSTHGLGVNTTRLIVFCVSAFFAGIAGALMVSQVGAANSTSFFPAQSLLLLVVLAMCGTRLLRSSVLAALVLSVLPGYAAELERSAFLNSTDRQLLLFGLAAIGSAIALARRGRSTGPRTRESVEAIERRPRRDPAATRPTRAVAAL